MKHYLYLKYIINIFRLSIYKIIYRKNIQFKILECLGKNFEISIKNQGKIILCEKVESRSNLHLFAHGGEIRVGKHCFFNTNCSITSVDSIKIGDECKIGNNVVFVDHDHDYKHISDKEFISSPITVGDNVWIGAGCIILRGSKIGNNSVIAAGSIVKGEVPANTVFVDKREKSLIKYK